MKSLALGLIFLVEAALSNPYSESNSYYGIGERLLDRKLTKEQVIAMNSEFDQFEFKNMVPRRCHPNEEHGFCSFPKGTGKYRLLILGNSYGANVADLIYNNFNEIVGNISKYTNSECEVLLQTPNIDGKNCAKSYRTYLQVAEQFKPDILFLINKHTSSANEFNSEKPDEDQALQRILKTVKQYEDLASTHVFIMDAIPLVRHSIHIKNLNEFIRNNEPFKEDESIQNYQMAQKRMDVVARTCTKCTVFNCNPVFTKGNKTILVDERTQLSYFTSGIHLSRAGLEAINPIFQQLAEDFVKSSSSSTFIPSDQTNSL